ncbi:glycosyltransferase family protein [Stieleria varia]|uniref:Uncharacterized protein n=1 Tax=Stieleria varia TaxID=2528005 RepID=A0A5C6AGR0_9BACT|nr:glycosyltransferase family 4 protein [Stieleria varia]TWT98630.1 hypothetical protein Pla52n_51470 [Stieleria varia]
MVLHSKLSTQLRRAGFRLVVLTPDSGAGSIKAFQSDQLATESVAFQKTHLLMTLNDARRYLREPIQENAALWSRHQYVASGLAGNYAKYRAWMNHAAHRLLFRRQFVHRAFDAVDRKFHRRAALVDKLRSISPSLVVSTYPVDPFEISGLLAAKELGIKTVGHLLSWDNITCKGRFTAVPDYFVSWGPVMSEEIEQHYGVDCDRIFPVGVPHFDAHREEIDPSLNSDVLQDLGLDPGKPYLFLGMSAPIFAPHEIDVVQWLADNVSTGRFGDDMQLVIRPHPQNVTGNMADVSWLDRLKAMRSSRVALNLPLLSQRGLSWDLETRDLTVLVNLLAGCSICLNSGSTLSIDALAHNKPVVLTMFDADRTDLPWWQSASRIREYPHYKKLIEMGGVSPVDSFAQLEAEIDAYLTDPDRNHQQRAETLARECRAIDGLSCERVATAFDRILEMGN